MIKHDSDRKAIMERIIERKSKLKISESNVLQISSPSILSHHENNVIDDYLIQNLIFYLLIYFLSANYVKLFFKI